MNEKDFSVVFIRCTFLPGNFHVARQMHPAPKKPPANQGYSGGESKYKISSTVTLSLVVENIENIAVS